MTSVTRYHDFSAGHRVFGHESKCAHLHGHNYRVHFTITAKELDSVGRVIDFSVIKTLLCEWLEQYWDHKFLIWIKDPWATIIGDLDPQGTALTLFNPTAENMAEFLFKTVAPILLEPHNVQLTHIRIEETRKCSVDYE